MKLTFNAIPFNPISRQDGQIWISSAELAAALGYSRADAINKIYERNSDEFTNTMTQNVNLTLSNKNNELQNVKTRIFSLRGCHLVAMFSRTRIAKAFRKWVLDILDKEMQPKEKRRSTIAERKGLRDAAAALVRQSHLAYADVFRMVHQRFQVESIEDLSPEQIHEAIHYLHSLTLQPQAEALPPTPWEYFMILAKMTAFAQEYLDLTRMMRKNDSNREQFNLAYDGWTACTPEDERQHGYVVFLNGNLKDDIQRAQNYLRQQSALLIGV